jgi:hypothetical protein
MCSQHFTTSSHLWKYKFIVAGAFLMGPGLVPRVPGAADELLHTGGHLVATILHHAASFRTFVPSLGAKGSNVYRTHSCYYRRCIWRHFIPILKISWARLGRRPLVVFTEWHLETGSWERLTNDQYPEIMSWPLWFNYPNYRSPLFLVWKYVALSLKAFLPPWAQLCW